MWAIPVVLCLSGTALADDLATAGRCEKPGVLGRAFGADRAVVSGALQFFFSPSDGLLPGAVVAIAKGGKLAYLQAIGFQDRAKTGPDEDEFHLLDRLDVQAGGQCRRHHSGG